MLEMTVNDNFETKHEFCRRVEFNEAIKCSDVQIYWQGRLQKDCNAEATHSEITR